MAQSSQYITFVNNHSCPLCGSRDYVVGAERREILQSVPVKPEELDTQAVVSFTPALCNNCQISFNETGISDETRSWIWGRYRFYKASSMGGANYQPYIDEVRKRLDSKSARVLEVGGYDGYLLRTLSNEGYTSLTLIDPAVVTDGIDQCRNRVTTVKGFFPEDEPVYRMRVERGRSYCCESKCPSVLENGDRHAHSCEPGNSHTMAEGLSLDTVGLYDVVACKEVLSVVPDIMQFVKGLNAVLRMGGTLVLTTPPFNSMHAMQIWHFNANAIDWIVSRCGFELTEHRVTSQVTYEIYVLTKIADVLYDAEVPDIADLIKPQRNENSGGYEGKVFSRHIQKQCIEQLAQSSTVSASAAARLNEKLRTHAELGHTLVIYGTGLQTFNILSCLDKTSASMELLLVNSLKDDEGSLFMLPDGSVKEVHWAVSALKDRHIPVLILGVLSPRFMEEITAVLHEINCTCDELISMQDLI